MTTSGRFDTLPQAQLLINPFDRIGDRPSVYNAAGIEGVIDVSAECVRLVSNRKPTILLWPEGTGYRLVDGRLFIELPDDRGQVQVGSKVELTGSSQSQAEPAVGDVVPEECPGPYFAVAVI